MRVPARALSAAIGAALIGLVVWSAWQRYAVLAASPFPLGVDGYFYPIQVRSLLETGTLQYPASPLTFWFMAPFAAATDPITGAKLGAAIGGALIALPAYAVGAQLGKSRGAGLVAAAIATTSATSAYLSIEFVKQGFGLTVALTALWLVLRAFATPTPSRGRIAAALASVLAALLTHKLAAAIVVGIAVPATIAELRTRGALRGRRLLYLYGVLAIAALVAVVLALIAPSRFIGARDLSLASTLFTSDARWSAPALAMPGFTLVFDHEAAYGLVAGILAALALLAQRYGLRLDKAAERDRVDRGFEARLIARVIAWSVFAVAIATGLPWLVAGILAALALLAKQLGLRIRKASEIEPAEPREPAPLHSQPGIRVAAWIIVTAAITIGLPWLDVTDPQGLAFRLRVTAFVPLALCVAIAAPTLVGWLDARWRDAALAAVAVAIVLRPQPPRTEGRVLAHPALVTAVIAATDQIPSNATVVVPERHILFMVAWYTRANVSLRPESVPYAQRVRLLPLAFTGMDSPLDHALDDARRDASIDPPLGLHPRHRNGLVLVTEPTWDWLLAHVLPRPAAYWRRWPTI